MMLSSCRATLEKVGLVALVVGAVLPHGGRASDPVQSGRSPAAGFSPEKLAAAVADYRRAVDDDEIRGAVLLVDRRGIVVLHEPLGWRNKEAGQPMRTDTLFRMASNTKAAIATGVLQLSLIHISEPTRPY